MQEQENTDGDGQTRASLFRVDQYVRMSTEHQSTRRRIRPVSARRSGRNLAYRGGSPEVKKPNREGLGLE